MKKLNSKPRAKRKQLFPKPVGYKNDPLYQGIKHLRQIQNSEGFYRP